MFSYDIHTEKSGPITTNVAHFFVPRISPLYPNVHITIRYQIHPITGLFLFKKEDDIQCFFSPYGYDSTSNFSSLYTDLEKVVSNDKKEFTYKTVVTMQLIDAKVSTKAFDSGIEFSAPHKTALVRIDALVRIEGHINTRGIGSAKCRVM